MPNVNFVLSQEITRLSKKVVNVSTRSTRNLVTQHRRDLAALKRQFASLTKRLALVEKKQPKGITAPPELLEKGRFRAIGVKAHRQKLGLSAKEYGELAGVSPLSIYAWESGKSYPRQAQKAKWLAIRGFGKREALERLGMAETKAAPVTKSAANPAPRKTFKRGTFEQTAAEMILSLLKGRKVLKTSQLVAAWKKSGRGGKVDNVLSLMVASRKLKRKPLGGKKGSEYRVG